MSNTAFQFKATLKLGDQIIPLLSEAADGGAQSQDGVTNGFLFQLNRLPTDPPVTLRLGDVIDLIENKLGASPLISQPGFGLITQAFPSFTATNFNAQNSTLIDVYEFTINSTTKQVLFSFNLNIAGSDPANGLIVLPPVLNTWLKINQLAVCFSATGSSSSTSTL